MKVGLATDHGGFGLKEELLTRLASAGHQVVDFGAHALESGDDYPDYVLPLARAVAEGEVERGIDRLRGHDPIQAVHLTAWRDAILEQVADLAA